MDAVESTGTSGPYTPIARPGRPAADVFGDPPGIDGDTMVSTVEECIRRKATASGPVADDVHRGRLAADLGCADQAHLSRDVTAIFDETPTQYAQRYPPG